MGSNSRIGLSQTGVSDVDQEYLIHAFHLARLSHHPKLSHTEAVRSADFWLLVQNEMLSHGRPKPANAWQLVWQRMHSKLLVRIEKARRQKRLDSSWLTSLNLRLLQVLMDDLDADRLEYLERCMAVDVSDKEDRLVLCAAVYRDVVADRFVMRCQQCQQKFSKADDMLSHIRRYYVDDEVPNPDVMQTSEHANTSEDDDSDDDVLRQEPIRSDSSNYPTKHVVPKKRIMQRNNVSPEHLESKPKIDQTECLSANNATASDDSSSDEDLDSRRRITKLHDSIFKFQCDKCRERFSTQIERHKHSVAVHGCASLLCPHCTAKFEDAKMLADHVKEHQKTFQCDICKRYFVGIGNLRSHMRMHDNSADFQCKQCSERFRYSFQREKHMHKKHGTVIVKQIICEHCARTFRYAYEMRRHLPRCKRVASVFKFKVKKPTSS